MKMKTKIFNFTVRAAVAAVALLCVLLGSFNLIIPSAISCYKGETPNKIPLTEIEFHASLPAMSSNDMVVRTTATAKICGIIPLKEISVNYYDKTSYYVGGFPFGIRFKTDGVVVVGFGDVETDSGKKNPAYSAGIRENDVILKANGQDVKSAAELTDAVGGSDGKEMTFTCRRDGTEFTVSLTPVRSLDGNFKTGMWIKDSGAGIGTVTYINPTDLSFGGLGHGICDGATGNVIPMTKGDATTVKLNGIEKGLPGTPGELKGSLTQDRCGTVLQNTVCGVFGVFDKLPSQAGELYQIGLRSDVHEGDATILTTLDGEGRQAYSAEISAISKDSKSNKCFTVRITDPALTGKTGGIIQGMSGSPIIQDGKLIGAVTHVMINDPTTGYGIFIENMLNTANIPMARAS